MKVNRVEQTVIRKSDAIWKTIDEFCYHAKNLYNYVNWIIRKELDEYDYYPPCYLISKIIKKTEEYTNCMSQPASALLRRVDKTWRGYFKEIKDWKTNKSKYRGMPKIPKYLKPNGRYVWEVPNNSCYLTEDGRLNFRIAKLKGSDWKTSAKGRLIQVRFVPKGTCYVMEVVTEVEISPEFKEPSRIAGIDLGVDNFVTISNNIGVQPIIINGKGIKSINQFYNKQRAYYMSFLKDKEYKWSERLSDITNKRFNRTKNFMHHASNEVIQYCKDNNVDTIVCGRNDWWKNKQNIGSKNNQNFQYIPYHMFVQQMEYKCQERGINFITTEESYTSGTSFLDNELPIRENYNKKRRKFRGLFKSAKGLINADLNGSLQIIKKVFPNAFADGIEACLTPLITNVIIC